MDTEYIYFSQKILYTWQVVGVGAGYIVNVFNYRLYLKESGRAHPGRAHPENKKKNNSGRAHPGGA